MYLNNLHQRDTKWNDEEYEYEIQGRDDLKGQVTKRSKKRGDSRGKTKERQKEQVLNLMTKKLIRIK